MALAGVKRCVQKAVKHEEFVQVLAERAPKNVVQSSFISKKHKVYTRTSSRCALSYLDIKRQILSCGIKTKPYGFVDME